MESSKAPQRQIAKDWVWLGNNPAPLRGNTRTRMGADARVGMESVQSQQCVGISARTWREDRQPCVPSNTSGPVDVSQRGARAASVCLVRSWCMLATHLVHARCTLGARLEPIPGRRQPGAAAGCCLLPGEMRRSGSWRTSEQALQEASLLILTISNPASKPAPFIYILTYDSFN